MRRNTDPNDTVHNSTNGHSSLLFLNQGLRDAINAVSKNLNSKLPAIDDLETTSMHLEDAQGDQTHDWVHGANVPVIETTDYSSANNMARERRRMKIEAEKKYQTPLNVDHGDADECIYTGFHDNNSLMPNENLIINHQNNCFTIINKHYAMKSDSSSELETCDDVEVIPRDGFGWYNTTSNEKELEHTNDPEKRTIWIYSFKNQPNLLTETEYELIDFPSISSSESSMDLGEEATAYETSFSSANAPARVATPMPTSYVPRLDLSKGSTLPTVTEITEVKSGDEKSPKVFVAKKPKNNWFANDTTPSIITAHSDHNEEKPSAFNWTPSSARERRRLLYGEDSNSRQEKTESTIQKLSYDTLETKRSVSSQTKPVQIIDLIDDRIESSRIHIGRPTTTIVEECVNNERPDDLQCVNTTSSPLLHATPKKLQKEVEPQSGNKTQTEEQNAAQESAEEMNNDEIKAEACALRITSVSLVTDSDEVTPIPSGPYKKLQIKVSPSAKPIITEPLENLESDDWICETKNEFSDSFDNIHLQIDNAGTRLLIRNDFLLRPSRWDDYSPVAASLPSLQITIGDSDSENDDTWWRRVLNCVLCRQTMLT